MEPRAARYADGPTVEVRCWVAASPEEVWPLITDVALPAVWSAELQRVEWLDGASGPSVGARFAGYNRHPAIGEWRSESTVVAYDWPRTFAWAVGNAGAIAASWRFDLEATDGGTTVTQWAQLGPGRSGLSGAIEAMPDKEERIVGNRLREWEAGMTANLEAIKRLAEGDGRGSGAPPGDGTRPA